jgi:hypothetical protein
MRNRWRILGVAIGAVLVATMTRSAHASTAGLVLRAGGFFEASQSQGGQCEVPTISNGIAVSTAQMGLWNTFGVPTSSYPLTRCEGWMEVINNQTSQGISVEMIDLRYRIAGAGRFRQFVPTRNGFPTACRSLRRSKVFTGAHLFAVGSDPDLSQTGSGAPHIAFVQLMPMVNAQVFHCLREQYAALPSNVYTSFPLIVRATAIGRTDAGDIVRSQPISFTLTLQHLCGNGRKDDLEFCDPNAPGQCTFGLCDTDNNVCTLDDRIRCFSDLDCAGTCMPQGDVNECLCVF